jgi:membrane dipeptidase
MTSVGMLVDLSHMSRKSSLQAIEHVAKPVVFTHSNARALHNHYRNITDEQATACAEVGGLIGISGSKMYTGEFPTLADGMFRHLDYMVQLVGPDHVGLGIDYVADTQALLRYLSDRPDEWPDAASTNVQSVEYLAPEDVWTVVSRMDSAGYPASAIRKILGENYIRIASEIWQ